MSLNKVAKLALQIMVKRSDRLVNETLGAQVVDLPLGALAQAFPPAYLAYAPMSVGSFVAGYNNPGTPEKYLDKTIVPNVVVPFYNSYTSGQRLGMVGEESKKRGGKPVRNLIAESFGFLPSVAVGAGVGAGLGSLFKSRAHPDISNATIGAVSGAALPVLASAAAAAITKRRSLQEQAGADTTGRAVAKYLVPGLSTYDAYKRLGASRNIIEDSLKDPEFMARLAERKKKLAERKKKQDAAARAFLEAMEIKTRD